jgi:hypothetical protein
MAIHLGTIVVSSKSVVKLLVERWAESKLQKARLILSLATLAFCLCTLFSIPTGRYTIMVLVWMQIVAMFWPGIMGVMVGPLLKRFTVIVPAEPRSEIVSEYHYDAAWFFYERTPELEDWYKANCVGWMGVIPERERETRHAKRLFWFTNKNDAFQFRMRWAGL